MWFNSVMCLLNFCLGVGAFMLASLANPISKERANSPKIDFYLMNSML